MKGVQCTALFKLESTVKNLNIGIYMSALKESLIRIYTVCHSVYIILEALLHCKIKLYYIKDNYGN